VRKKTNAYERRDDNAGLLTTADASRPAASRTNVMPNRVR
jgi:hypothetical protein